VGYIFCERANHSEKRWPYKTQILKDLFRHNNTTYLEYSKSKQGEQQNTNVYIKCGPNVYIVAVTVQ